MEEKNYKEEIINNTKDESYEEKQGYDENEKYDEDEEYDEDQEYDEDYYEYESLKYEEKYNKYRPERTSSFHNSSNYSNKKSIDHITHKEISQDIKNISINTFYVSKALIIILGIIALLYCIFGVMIDEGEPLLGFIYAIISILTMIGLLNIYYFIFLLATGFAGLIEDVNQIKKSLLKIDEQNDFDNLPRL